MCFQNSLNSGRFKKNILHCCTIPTCYRQNPSTPFTCRTQVGAGHAHCRGFTLWEWSGWRYYVSACLPTLLSPSTERGGGGSYINTPLGLYITPRTIILSSWNSSPHPFPFTHNHFPPNEKKLAPMNSNSREKQSLIISKESLTQLIPFDNNYHMDFSFQTAWYYEKKELWDYGDWILSFQAIFQDAF